MLERKFGGKRRQIAIFLRELEEFEPIWDENAKDIEEFAELLDVAVINLKEAGRYQELGNGVLYKVLLRKLTESLLTQYQRWVFENNKTESVEALLEWVLLESEFHVMASETIHGMCSRSSLKNWDNSGNQTDDCRDVDDIMCQICNSSDHSVSACGEFQHMSVGYRWDMARLHKLCFRCLSQDHIGQACPRTRICEKDGCQLNHHRLLHR